MSLLHHAVRREPLAELSCFRGEFYSCLTARSDALFELADAVLCSDGPVRSLAELSLVGEHRRGHGGLYAALAHGRINPGQLRRALAEVPLPRTADGRLVLAIDVTCWLRPDAHTSPERILCHTYGRGKDQHIPVPGWPYSIICALEPGRSSWTAPLDALRLAPGDDTATVTARQLRDLLQRLITAGQWQTGDPDILQAVRAFFDVTLKRIADPDLPDGCLVAQTAMAIPVLSPNIAARAIEALGFQRARLRTALLAAKLADGDAENFAVHIAAVNQSLAVMSRAGASRNQLHTIIDISMSALSHALRAPRA
ncbi:transposase [Streptomyces sp. NBC_01003]|uniref:transposase n=1 Tax=Streptomyces sp. NBC_01003 TaxID=2903714 RepID=UPI00386F826E|nr:transposase [Streptomyces sp. NBC_01003]